MRIQLLLLLLVMVLPSCNSPARTGVSSQNPELFIVHVDGKAGYIDGRGQLVIQPHFDEASPFSEGLAAVRIGDVSTGKWGYIDSVGHLEIEPRFGGAGAFSNGLALVNLSTEVAAYIDRKGSVAITPQQVSVDGVAARFTHAFQEGLAPFIIDEIGSPLRAGYINIDGKIAIEPRFANAFSFQGGRAQVFLSEQPSRAAFVDKSGTLLGAPFEICKPLLDGELEFSEDYAAAQFGCGGKWGYVDHFGRFQILPQFATAGSFHSDLARVQVAVMVAYRPAPPGGELLVARNDEDGGRKNGSVYGYIHKSGILVISPRFRDAQMFSEGLAAVQMALKWGFIDTSGRFAIPAKFDAARSFSGGLAEVSIGKARGYIDKTGEFVWKPTI
ncbi:MAG: WG repeat-containing protein [Bryobacteraceae bacterium]